ncbi:MAG: hypothetical protein APF76_03525 [Desulfitibacter sp. BRH_c19]|nr:MAG: hypothetical protein APF76_03525 [Desulfitibacter sp. BRH_c19]
MKKIMMRNNNKIFIFCLLLLGAMLLMPTATFAADDIVRFGGGVKVGDEQTAQNVVAFGGPVKVEGAVNSVVAFGGSVRSTGIIKGDTVAFGGGVNLDGPVAGNVVAFGGGVALGENAVVNGDIVVLGGKVSKHPSATVSGEIKIYNNPSDIIIKSPHFFRDTSHDVFTGITWWIKIVGSILMVALGWLIAILLPRNTENIIDRICNDGPKSFGIGLLIKLLALPITIALLITILGIPLIPIFWLALWFTQLMGLAALGLLLGRKLFNRLGHNISLGIAVLVGLIIIALFRQIPFAGVVILFFVKSLVLGAVVTSKFGTSTWGNKGN